MKNWNYIEGAKVGNESIASHPESLVAQEIYKIYKDAGKDENKALEVLATKYKSIPKEALKKHLKDAMKAYDTMIKNSKTGAEEFFKKLSDDVKEREKKDDTDIEKVGNALGKDIYQHKLDPNQYMVVDWDKDTVTIIVNGVVRDVIKNTDKVAYAVDHVYKRVNSMNKVGNSSVSGGTFKNDDGSQKAVIDVNPQSGTARVVWFENDRQNGSSDYRSIDLATAAVKRKGLKKVGNSTYDMTDRDYENEYKSLVQKRNNVQRGTKEYEEIQKRLDEIRKKLGRSPFGNKIGNAKDKNDKDLKVGDIVDVRGKKGKITKIIGDVIEVFYDNSGTYNPDRIDRHYADEAKKVGNEAPDDKFAYVMREFNEGKLKTPDGKVVTDPAQAKAIAYSESKKTENGLARARNAMAGNWNSDRNIKPVVAYKEFIANLKNAIELGVAAVTYNIDGSTLKTWVEQAKKEGYGSHISGIQGQKVILK